MTNDDKSNSLTADQNELPEPASPGDVSGANPRQAGCTEQEEKAESLPDLIRLFKNRARDGDIIKKCKIMLVARKAASKFKPIHINPTRRSRRADVGKSAGRTATA